VTFDLRNRIKTAQVAPHQRYVNNSIAYLNNETYQITARLEKYARENADQQCIRAFPFKYLRLPPLNSSPEFKKKFLFDQLKLIYTDQQWNLGMPPFHQLQGSFLTPEELFRNDRLEFELKTFPKGFPELEMGCSPMTDSAFDSYRYTPYYAYMQTSLEFYELLAQCMLMIKDVGLALRTAEINFKQINGSSWFDDSAPSQRCQVDMYAVYYHFFHLYRSFAVMVKNSQLNTGKYFEYFANRVRKQTKENQLKRQQQEACKEYVNDQSDALSITGSEDELFTLTPARLQELVNEIATLKRKVSECEITNEKITKRTKHD
jgi:hypothetical protein